jgi:multimeric flavodoxin WrbA
MKVLGIVCSPRKGGNTEILVREALKGASASGATTRLVTVSGKDIRPCNGCRSCVDTGKCQIQDDMQEIYPRIIEANGIIWGTPIYFHGASAQAKIQIDRLHALYTKSRLRNKVGGIISVAAGTGHLGAFYLFNSFFSINRMFSTDPVEGYAAEKGGIRKDKNAMKAAQELGRQVVQVVRRQFKYPEEYDIVIPRYVEREYGISSSPSAARFSE